MAVECPFARFDLKTTTRRRASASANFCAARLLTRSSPLVVDTLVAIVRFALSRRLWLNYEPLASARPPSSSPSSPSSVAAAVAAADRTLHGGGRFFVRIGGGGGDSTRRADDDGAADCECRDDVPRATTKTKTTRLDSNQPTQWSLLIVLRRSTARVVDSDDD